MLLLILVSSISLVSGANYSDPFARNVMFPLTAAAYSQDPQLCLTAKFSDANLKRQINVDCDFFITDTCSGYSAVIPSEKAIILSFRGTEQFLQLVSEGSKSIFRQKTAWIAGGKVSKYFGDAFIRVWNQGMKDDFLTLLNQYPGFEIWVTGHSLGGAIASLAASFIQSNQLIPSDMIKLVTFGAPRIGNKEFATAHDNQMDYAFRITHWRDIVPHVPNEGFEGYHHAKHEVFYTKNMTPENYIVCQEQEDRNCSDGLLVTTDIVEHLRYFDRDVTSWGSHGCKK